MRGAQSRGAVEPEPPASRARSVRHGARGPGTSPLPPLLLLLLGAGFLPGKFQGAGRIPSPGSGGLGPPDLRKGVLLAAVPSLGYAQRQLRRPPPCIPQTQKTVLRSAGGARRRKS